MNLWHPDNPLVCFSLLLVPAYTEGTKNRIGIAETPISVSISGGPEQDWEMKDITIL